MTVYHIGRRRPINRRFKWMAAAVILTAVFFLLHTMFSGRIFSYARSTAQNAAVSAINAGVLGALESSDDTDKLVSIRYKTDGSVASIETNSARLLNLRTSLTLAVLQQIGEAEKQQFSVSIGTLLSNDFLTGRGPEIPFYLGKTEALNAYFENRFLSAGINQTLHRIVFTVELDIDLLLSTRRETLHIVQSFPIAETLIAGEVPSFYLNHTRLTEDLSADDLRRIYTLLN